MALAEKIIEYYKEIDENQKQVQEMVLESYRDIESGKGRDCNEFFGKLEKKYSDDKI